MGGGGVEAQNFCGMLLTLEAHSLTPGRYHKNIHLRNSKFEDSILPVFLLEWEYLNTCKFIFIIASLKCSIYFMQHYTKYSCAVYHFLISNYIFLIVNTGFWICPHCEKCQISLSSQTSYIFKVLKNSLHIHVVIKNIRKHANED